MAKINYKYQNHIHILLLLSSLLACVFSSMFSYVVVRGNVVTEIQEEQRTVAASILEMEEKTDLSTGDILEFVKSQSHAFSIKPVSQLDMPEKFSQELNENGYVTFKRRKTDMPVTYVKVNNTTAVEIAAPGSFSIAGNVFTRLAYIVFSFLIISMLASWVSSYRIANPVSELIHATDLVQQGDYSVRVPEDRDGELGNLIHSFNAMTEALGKTSYLQKDFISSVSHEFRTPIASIHGFARLLKMDSLSEEQRREYLDIIEQESDRLSKLSNTLLRLTSLEQRSEPPKMSKFQLDEQLRQVIVRMETTWEPKNIDWNLQLDSVVVCSDSDLLNEVWMNLIQNAIKFSPDNSTISITLTGGSGVTVAIADEGIGMSEETMERIFDMFYQGDTSHSKEGVGLGLSLVKRIISILSGEITVKSQPGQGSCFIVKLPQGY